MGMNQIHRRKISLQVILEQHSSVLKTSAELAVFVQCGSGVVSECKSDINLQCDV